MPTATPCALVIFGASGDLAKLKLIPAIYELAHEKLLPEKFALIGSTKRRESFFSSPLRKRVSSVFFPMGEIPT